MTLTLAEFRTRHPEFNQVADSRINTYLADSVPYVTSPPLKFAITPQENKAQALVIAHWCSTIPQVDNDGNPVDIGNLASETSYKVGNIQIVEKNTSSTVSAGKSSSYLTEFSNTNYGQQYISILKLHDPNNTSAGSGTNAKPFYGAYQFGGVLR